MGLVIPNLVNSFFAQLAVKLSGVLRSSGFTLVISSSEEDPELEQREIDHLLARGVDALLVASLRPGPETFRRLEGRKVPYILLGRLQGYTRTLTRHGILVDPGTHRER